MTADAGTRDVDDDPAKLQGEWELVASTLDGVSASEEEIARTRLIISGSSFTVTGDAVVGTSPSGSFVLDPTKRPKWITSTASDGPDQGKASLGIYEIDGDEQTACFGAPGSGQRPDAFTSEPGSGRNLQVWRRATA
jgi:uncharacterized protein (TIGR03067 family)